MVEKKIWSKKNFGPKKFGQKKNIWFPKNRKKKCWYQKQKFGQQNFSQNIARDPQGRPQKIYVRIARDALSTILPLCQNRTGRYSDIMSE